MCFKRKTMEIKFYGNANSGCCLFYGLLQPCKKAKKGNFDFVLCSVLCQVQSCIEFKKFTRSSNELTFNSSSKFSPSPSWTRGKKGTLNLSWKSVQLNFFWTFWTLNSSDIYIYRLQFYLRSASAFWKTCLPNCWDEKARRHGASVDVQKNLKDVQAANVNAGINSE